MFGFAGVAMAGVAVVWYLVFQLVVLGITWSPSFDSVGWALDRCDITGSGEPLKSRRAIVSIFTFATLWLRRQSPTVSYPHGGTSRCV
jgi:hypothetical protein